MRGMHSPGVPTISRVTNSSNETIGASGWPGCSICASRALRRTSQVLRAASKAAARVSPTTMCAGECGGMASASPVSSAPRPLPTRPQPPGRRTTTRMRRRLLGRVVAPASLFDRGRRARHTTGSNQTAPGRHDDRRDHRRPLQHQLCQPAARPRQVPVVRDGRCRSGRLHAQPARTSTRRGGSFGARGSRSVSTPCFSSA